MAFIADRINRIKPSSVGQAAALGSLLVHKIGSPSILKFLCSAAMPLKRTCEKLS